MHTYRYEYIPEISRTVQGEARVLIQEPVLLDKIMITVSCFK